MEVAELVALQPATQPETEASEFLDREAIPEDPKPAQQTSRLLDALRNITVEPVLFFYIAGWNLLLVVGSAGLYWKVCMQNFGLNGTANCTELPYPKHVEDVVQRETAIWGLYEMLAVLIPLLVAGPIFGALGDKYGRKWNILFGLGGVVQYAGLYYLQFGFVELPLYIIPVACVVLAFLGYGANIYATCYAYVADITLNEDDLTFRYTLLEAVCKSADIIFSFINAIIITALSYSNSMLFAMAVWGTAGLYTLLFLKQQTTSSVAAANLEETIVTKESKRRSSREIADLRQLSVDSVIMDCDLEICSDKRKQNTAADGLWRAIRELCRESVATAFKPRPGRNRLFLWLCILSSFLLKMADAGWMVLNLFAFHSPINWTGFDVSIFYGVSATMISIGTLLGSYLLKRLFKLHETSIILIGVASTTCQYIWTGLSESGVSLYIAGVAGMFGSLAGPALKSLVNQFIDKDEIGKTLTLFCLASDMGWMAAFAFSNSFYAATADIYPGLVYFVSAVLLLIGATPIMWLHLTLLNERRKRTGSILAKRTTDIGKAKGNGKKKAREMVDMQSKGRKSALEKISEKDERETFI